MEGFERGAEDDLEGFRCTSLTDAILIDLQAMGVRSAREHLEDDRNEHPTTERDLSSLEEGVSGSSLGMRVCRFQK